MRLTRHRTIHAQSILGSVIIEAMIALVLIGVGAIAASRMQMQSLRNIQAANNRTTATYLAQEMVERMKTLPSTDVNSLDRSTANALDASSYITNPNCGTESNVCSGTNGRDKMVYDWSQKVARYFPKAKLTICRTATLQADGPSAVNCDGSGNMVVKIWYPDFNLDTSINTGASAAELKDASLVTAEFK